MQTAIRALKSYYRSAHVVLMGLRTQFKRKEGGRGTTGTASLETGSRKSSGKGKTTLYVNNYTEALEYFIIKQYRRANDHATATFRIPRLLTCLTQALRGKKKKL